MSCLDWAHEECAGIEDDSVEFRCDFCSEVLNQTLSQIISAYEIASM
jgi:hypothetical protein